MVRDPLLRHGLIIVTSLLCVHRYQGSAATGNRREVGGDQVRYRQLLGRRALQRRGPVPRQGLLCAGVHVCS